MANQTTIRSRGGRGLPEKCMLSSWKVASVKTVIRLGSDLEATSIEINGYKSPTSRIEVVQEPLLKSERLE